MPKRSRFYTPQKSKRSRRVARNLFPETPMGQPYNRTLKKKIGKVEKKKSFSAKVNNLTYPAFQVLTHDTHAVNTSGMSPMNFGLVTGVTSPKTGYDGLQHIRVNHFYSREQALKAFNKCRDIYSQSANNDQPPEFNPSDPTLAFDFERGLKLTCKSITYAAQFMNNANASAEFEILVCTPKRFVPRDGLSTYFEYEKDPYRAWIYSNTKAGLELESNTVDTYNLVADPLVDANWVAEYADYSVNPQHLGDRPYKGPGREHWHKHWRILDKKTFKLQPGFTQKYNFTYRKNQVFDFEDLKNHHRIPYLDLFVMVISKGQLVSGTNAGNSDISTSDICYLHQSTMYHSYQPKRIRRPIKIVENQDWYNPDLGAGNQQFINHETDAHTVWNGGNVV